MAVLTLQGTGVTDTFIDSSGPTTNSSTNITLPIGESNVATQVIRTVVKFDLSSVPTGSVIDSAVMTLYMSAFADESDNARVVSVYRILQGVDITQCTWNSYKTGSVWATAGCGNTTSDREDVNISDGPTQPATSVENTALVFNLTPAKVKEITDGTFTNNGFLLKVATENNDLVNYKSTEHTDTIYRPKLVVTYHAASSGFFAFL